MKKIIAKLLFVICLIMFSILKVEAYTAINHYSITVKVSIENYDKTTDIVMKRISNNAPMPADDTLKAQPNKETDFGDITYTEPGTYEYEIYQKQNDSTITYDDTIYIYTVLVKDVNNELEIASVLKNTSTEEKVEIAQFNNKKITSEKTPKPVMTPTGTKAESSPNTSDMIFKYIILLIVSLILLIILTIILIKSKKNK